jgi:peptidoglycan/xylan/chitin deacetylase (PgdA/CDA1 family)
MLTFDDGLREMYDVVAPMLRQRGITAVFFICTAFLDNRELFFRHMASLLVDRLLERTDGRSAWRREVARLAGTEETGAGGLARAILSIRHDRRSALQDLADVLDVDFGHFLKASRPYLTTAEVNHLMSDGFAIGAHSLDHPYYRSVSLEEQLRQTLESVRELSRRFAVDHKVFAFPFEDRGVPREFFRQVTDEGVRLCFGASGMRDDDCRCNVPRFWMEGTGASARTILAIEHTKALLRRSVGKNKMERR